MQFDPDNTIVQLCAKGMEMEGAGKPEEAARLFGEAWTKASNDFEKLTSAHYVARHQSTVKDKLTWDETALHFALRIPDTNIKDVLPSLYLNIGKCYEDLNDPDTALKNYELALDHARSLPDDGYGNMIRAGIANGIKRTVNA
jgi:rifampin ADP-ribosylating transferase